MMKIKTNTAAWKRFIDRAADFSAAAVAEQMMTDCSDLIPDDGEHLLVKSGRVEAPEKGSRDLVWRKVYAGYQYFGIRADGAHKVRNYTTPGTGKLWVEVAQAVNGKNWEKAAQNAFAQRMKEQ